MIGANPHAARLRGCEREARHHRGHGGLRRVRGPRGHGRDRRHVRVPQPRRVRCHRVRLDRDRTARARESVRDRAGRDPVGLLPRRCAADAAGDGPLDRHRPDRAGVHPVVRRRRRDRAHDLPYPAAAEAARWRRRNSGRHGARRHDVWTCEPATGAARRRVAPRLGRFQVIGLLFGMLGVSCSCVPRAEHRADGQGRHVRTAAGPGELLVRSAHDHHRDRRVLPAHCGARCSARATSATRAPG